MGASAGVVRALQSIVMGLGQPLAGDDAVGIHVARSVAARGVTTIESTDASVILDLLDRFDRVVVVDAIVGAGRLGDVCVIPTDGVGPGLTMSTHGLGLSEALRLAALLRGDISSAVDIVGVTIGRPPRLGDRMSPVVVAAVEQAADLAERLALRPLGVLRSSHA